MTEQSNIRRLSRCVLFLIVLLIAIILTVTNSFGRYSTKVSNIVQFTASSAPKIYVSVPQPVPEPEIVDTEQDDTAPTEVEQSDVTDSSESELPRPIEPEVIEFERDQLISLPAWTTVGGEQYTTFTVSNSFNSEIPEKDVIFRIRVVLPDRETTDGLDINYTSLYFSLETNGNTHSSRIYPIYSRTAFYKKNAIDGWIYSFQETINEEPQYTLKGNSYNEITFTLSVNNIEFDCSELSIYIDRIK